MKDLIGKAILDYQTNNAPQNIITETTISEADEMEIAYLFRNFDQMPIIEQTALQLSRGKILDVGCGAGSHALHLQNNGHNVTAIDISPNAIQACKLRGITTAEAANIMDYEGDFDTILLLMNGTGICGTIENTVPFFKKLKSLLNENGQILIDSSDLLYMYDDDEIAQKYKDSEYYGQLTFEVSYKNEREQPFEWLYLDLEMLKEQANIAGLICEVVLEGDSNDYLARLSH